MARLVDFLFFNPGLVSAIIELLILLGSVHFPIDVLKTYLIIGYNVDAKTMFTKNGSYKRTST